MLWGAIAKQGSTAISTLIAIVALLSPLAAAETTLRLEATRSNANTSTSSEQSQNEETRPAIKLQATRSGDQSTSSAYPGEPGTSATLTPITREPKSAALSTTGLPSQPTSPQSSTLPEPSQPTGVPGTPPSSTSSIPGSSDSTPPRSRPNPISASTHQNTANLLLNEGTSEGGERRPESGSDSSLIETTDGSAAREAIFEATLSSSNKLSQSGGSLLSGGPNQPVLTMREPLAPLEQIVVLADDLQQAEAQRRRLSQEGIGIIARRNLTNLGIVQSTFQFRAPMTAEEVLALLFELDPNTLAEQNQRYRLQSADIKIPRKKALGHALSDLKAPTTCSSQSHIAMLDSTVNIDALDNLAGEIFTYSPLKSSNQPKRHGTAIANILLSGSDKYPGILKNTTLHAIGIFDWDPEGQPETRTDWILAGLDILAGLATAPKVVNLSFGGPYSAVQKRIYGRLSDRFIFIAAAGNSGTNEVLYPAGYDSVIAVGAFNGKGQRYGLSNTGEHIQILGPGEDIWTRNESGKGYYAYGTSFAAPFVSAALLLSTDKNVGFKDYLKSLDSNRYVSFKTLCPNS